ncbi:Cro/CI family transcriptional regulator [Yersinia enterocolitica]|uniref:Cro n=1 Tax=Yersinia enterocolitica TaxID=630 RepID=A0ABM9S8X9_YEREN|nr:Cro/CI family transcriptional regulator [Yersinia enterocolitica]CNE47438.1 Cro [Yersinia enterocolitica]CQD62249.1 Cro [Yersinia enterocolitica]CRX79454.1 Cro [Yersinia enterocolitica]
MKRLSLSAFANEYGQANAANMLGVRQSAINKAMKYKRKITVILHDNGDIEAEELRKFPSQLPRNKTTQD